MPCPTVAFAPSPFDACGIAAIGGGRWATVPARAYTRLSPRHGSGSKTAEAIAPRHYQDGCPSTGTCGTFASAAAAMKLYGADAPACARALSFGVHPEAERAGYDKMARILDLHLKDGRTISGRADFAKGRPSDPMTLDEVAAKFEDCARFAQLARRPTNDLIQGVR